MKKKEAKRLADERDRYRQTCAQMSIDLKNEATNHKEPTVVCVLSVLSTFLEKMAKFG